MKRKFYISLVAHPLIALIVWAILLIVHALNKPRVWEEISNIGYAFLGILIQYLYSYVCPLQRLLFSTYFYQYHLQFAQSIWIIVVIVSFIPAFIFGIKAYKKLDKRSLILFNIFWGLVWYQPFIQMVLRWRPFLYCGE